MLNESSVLKSIKQPASINKEDFKAEDLDIDNLTLIAKKQFLKDIAVDPLVNKQITALSINLRELWRLTDEEFEKLIENSPLEKILVSNDEKIEEAYENIVGCFNRGELPIITIDAQYLDRLLHGIAPAMDQNSFDGQMITVGTIGREPFLKGNRIICKIHNIAPNELLPRSTGPGHRGTDFKFNGVVVLNKDFIPPEDIEIISAHRDELPSGVKLPIFLDKFKEYYNSKAT